MAGLSFGLLARKYGAVIFFPTFTAATIYADWSHTREWKRKLQEKGLLKNRELKS